MPEQPASPRPSETREAPDDTRAGAGSRLYRAASWVFTAGLATWLLVRGAQRQRRVPRPPDATPEARQSDAEIDPRSRDIGAGAATAGAALAEADVPPAGGPTSPPTAWVPAALIVSILSSISLAFVYARGGQPQAEGVLLAIALAGLSTGIILWAKELLRPEHVIDRIDTERSPASVRRTALAALEQGEQQVARRHLLAGLLAGALGSLGLAALFPIRSLGPGPGLALFHTEWSPGAVLVNYGNQPVRVTDVNVGGVITVFPQDHAGSPISQTLLIRVEPGLLKLPPDRLAWAPQGFIAYSKICTHAGCPVGLYQESTHQLLCPCHQSTFDVLRGARRVFGPAVRPLPQLPLEIGADGILRAGGDFPEPVGPGFWNRP